jgi:peroxiredoxin
MAPDFTRITASGSRLTLSDLRGQVVLVNFWATCCPPCVREMPWFDEFQHTYTDLAVVGVSMDEEGWDAVRPFLTKAGVNYPIVLGDDDLRRDYGDLSALPMTMLIDRSGRIVSMHTGLIDKETYANAILAALTAPSSRRKIDLAFIRDARRGCPVRGLDPARSRTSGERRRRASPPQDSRRVRFDGRAKPGRHQFHHVKSGADLNELRPRAG